MMLGKIIQLFSFRRLPSCTVEEVGSEEVYSEPSEPDHQIIIQPATNLICEYIVDYLCTKYGSITAVYLYGSRAYGNYRPNSDHDFYFVYQTGYECGLDFKNPEFLEHIEELRNDAKFHFGCKVDIDVMGCSLKMFDEMKMDTDSHAGKANNHGDLLYSL